MSLPNKYELIEAVGGFGIKVQRAREIGSERRVLLHKLDASSPSSLQALKLALQYTIAYPGSRAFLEVVDEGNSLYVVTEDQPEYISLMDWLPAALSVPLGKARESWPVSGGSPDNAAKAVPEGNPPASTDGPGEFTRIFNPERTDGGFRGNAGASTQAKADGWPGGDQTMLRPMQPQAGGPGEFTQIFKPGLRNANATVGQPGFEDRVPPMAADEKTPASRTEPGEYTRLFRTDSAALRDPGPRVGDVSRGEGSHGIIPAGPAQNAELFGERAASEPSRNAPSGPSEFTRVIRGGGSARSLGGSTWPLERGPVTAESPVPAAGSAAPPVSAGQVPKLQAPEVPIKPPAVEPLVEKGAAVVSGRSFPVLALILGGLFLIALALIVVFLLRR